MIGELENRDRTVPATFSTGCLDMRHRLPDHMVKDMGALTAGTKPSVMGFPRPRMRVTSQAFIAQASRTVSISERIDLCTFCSTHPSFWRRNSKTSLWKLYLVMILTPIPAPRPLSKVRSRTLEWIVRLALGLVMVDLNQLKAFARCDSSRARSSAPACRKLRSDAVRSKPAKFG